MKSLSKKELFASFALISAAVFALYGQTLSFGFVWDDHIEVLGNTVFHDWRNLGKFFTVPYWYLLTGGFAPYHRPLIPVMILSVSTFFGKNPFGYHLLNLVLYTLTAWCFYSFLRLRSLSRVLSLTAAAIFIFHPAHTEAVAWGSARPVLLSGLCFIACLICSTQLGLSNQRRTQKTAFTALLFFFTLGLLTYHSILTLIPFIAAADWLKLSSSPKPVRLKIAEYSAYVLLTAGFVIYCLLIFKHWGETDLRPLYSAPTANVVYTGAPEEWFLAPLNTLSRYAETLFFPLNLNPDPVFQASQVSTSALGVLILISGFTFWISRKADYKKDVLLSVLWMICGVLTVANLVPQGGLFADRYTYISSMGFALWLALLLKFLTEEIRQRIGREIFAPYIPAVILLSLFAFKTLTYSRVWKNDFTFWLEASILSPDRARTHDKLGIQLASSGHFTEAAEEFQKAIQLDGTNFPMTYKRLAGVLTQLGKTEEALQAEQQYASRIRSAEQNSALRISN